MSNYGWGAAANVEKGLTPTGKKKKPAPAAQTSNVGAMDPFGAIISGRVTSPSDIARLMGMIQPDRSSIPSIDLDSLRTAAHTTAQMQIAPYKDALAAERQQTLDDQRISQGAATAFTKALTEMLQGGKTGQAGMDYAKENYGGSYLGAIAGQMGAQLFGQITSGFTEQLNDITDRLSELISKSPEIENDIYDQISKAAFDEQGNAIKMAELDVQTKVKAAAVILKQANDDRKALTAMAKALGAGGNDLQMVQNRDGSFIFNKKTGTFTQVYKTTTPDGKVSYKVINGVGGSLVPGADGVQHFVPDPNAPKKPPKEKKGISVAARNTALENADQHGTAALNDVLARIKANTPNVVAPPGWYKKNPKLKWEDSEEYASARTEAHRRAQLNFNTAVTKVRMKISSYLKTLNYTPEQIYDYAYQIVTQRIQPLPTYKRPKF